MSLARRDPAGCVAETPCRPPSRANSPHNKQSRVRAARRLAALTLSAHSQSSVKASTRDVCTVVVEPGV